MKAALFLVCFGFWLAGSLVAQEKPVDGVYLVSGTDGQGKDYTGWAIIGKGGILWETPCGTIGVGRILASGDTLAIVFEGSAGLGQGLYVKNSKGELIGRWNIVGESSDHPETLTPTERTLEQLRAQACEKEIVA